MAGTDPLQPLLCTRPALALGSVNLFRSVLIATLMIIGFGCTDDRKTPSIVVDRVDWWATQIESASQTDLTPKSLASALEELGATGPLGSTGETNVYTAKLERVESDELFCGYVHLMLYAYFDEDGRFEDRTIFTSATCLQGEKR